MPDRFRRFADLRAWLRHLARASTHSGVTAVLATVGTNAAENLAPVALRGLGLDWRQMLAAFATAAFLTALREIQQATAPTRPPFAP